MATPQLLTAGRIAADLRVPLPRIQYILATRPHIQPAARAGTLRLYDRRTAVLIGDELRLIESRKGSTAADGRQP